MKDRQIFINDYVSRLQRKMTDISFDLLRLAGNTQYIEGTDFRESFQSHLRAHLNMTKTLLDEMNEG